MCMEELRHLFDLIAVLHHDIGEFLVHLLIYPLATLDGFEVLQELEGTLG